MWRHTPCFLRNHLGILHISSKFNSPVKERSASPWPQIKLPNKKILHHSFHMTKASVKCNCIICKSFNEALLVLLAIKPQDECLLTGLNDSVCFVHQNACQKKKKIKLKKKYRKVLICTDFSSQLSYSSIVLLITLSNLSLSKFKSSKMKVEQTFWGWNEWFLSFSTMELPHNRTGLIMHF